MSLALDVSCLQAWSAFGGDQASLEIADDCAKPAGGEKAWPKRTGTILTDWWELPESSSGSHGHATELPLDLLADSLWAVGCGKPNRLCGVRGSTESVCAHMGDGGGLSCRSGRSGCRRAANLP
jgi:hypothetical protein